MLGAIEGGGTKFLCAVGEGHDAVVASQRIQTRTPDETLEEVAAFLGRYELEAVGIGMFGPLELSAGPRWGSLLRTPKPDWSDAPVASRISEALGGVPVAIDTDVNAAALGEATWGAARGADPVLYLTVGTGVGGGVLVHGAPVHGLMHPELGHLPVPVLTDAEGRPDPFPGACLFHGRCLEGVASGPALHARLGLSAEEIADEHPVWELTGRYVGHALASAVLVLSPERIVVGGGVATRPALLPAARRALSEALAGYVARPQLGASIDEYVVRPGLGDRSGIAGAFALAKTCTA